MNQGSVTYIWYSVQLPNDYKSATKVNQTTKCPHSQNFHMMFMRFLNFFHRSHNTVLIRWKYYANWFWNNVFYQIQLFSYHNMTFVELKNWIQNRIVWLHLILYPLRPFDPDENQNWAFFNFCANGIGRCPKVITWLWLDYSFCWKF